MRLSLYNSVITKRIIDKTAYARFNILRAVKIKRCYKLTAYKTSRPKNVGAELEEYTFKISVYKL
jgi:hypothetical protein